MSTSLLIAECIAFKPQQSGKYVSYVRDDVSHGLKKILQVRGDTTKSPFTRFHPEPSIEQDGYYHIKCLYNNKYWAVHQHGRGSYIFVDADVPNEDLSSPSCTLFQIEIGAHNSCRISHAVGGVSIHTSSDSPSGSLLVGNREPEALKLILMQSKTVLPKYVCFKGDNGKYLWEATQRGRNFLGFSASDKNDWRAFHTIRTNEDGTICVYNNSVDRWWRLSPSWIWADYNDDNGDPSNHGETTFLPTKLADDKVGLKCLGNNKFCKRLTDYWQDALNACVDTMTTEAVLQVEEPLLSRRIYDVEYHLEDARVYDKENIYVSNVSHVNGTSKEQQLEIPIEYSVTEEKTWNSSTSWKLGAQLTIGGEIPYVGANMEVQLQAEQGGSHAWGATSQVQVKSNYTFRGSVGAHKMITVEIEVSRAACDVPYSYWQEDVLSDGKRVIQKFDDGIFHGVNKYDVTAKASETDIE